MHSTESLRRCLTAFPRIHMAHSLNCIRMSRPLLPTYVQVISVRTQRVQLFDPMTFGVIGRRLTVKRLDDFKCESRLTVFTNSSMEYRASTLLRERTPHMITPTFMRNTSRLPDVLFSHFFVRDNVYEK